MFVAYLQVEDTHRTVGEFNATVNNDIVVTYFQTKFIQCLDCL